MSVVPSWDESALLSCAYAVLSAVRSADVACDLLCDDALQALAKVEAAPHAAAAARAAERARSQAVALGRQLGPKSKRARMADQAAQAALRCAVGAREGMDPEDLDAALGRAQRAAVAIFDLLGRPRPALAVTEGPAAVLPAPPPSRPTLPAAPPTEPATGTLGEQDTLPAPAPR